MQKTIILLFILAAIQFGFTPKEKYQSIVIKTQIYCSHCLQCGSCGANINEHITLNKGIKSVAIDPKLNTITVRYDASKISVDKIRAAILSAGFDADDLKATAAAVDALDGCCKKH